MKRVIPIGKKILVKPVPKKEQTNSGIYLPEAQQQQIPQGTIVSKGGSSLEELSIGDFVQWNIEMSDGQEFIHEGEMHLLMSDTCIVAKLEDV